MKDITRQEFVQEVKKICGFDCSETVFCPFSDECHAMMLWDAIGKLDDVTYMLIEFNKTEWAASNIEYYVTINTNLYGDGNEGWFGVGETRSEAICSCIAKKYDWNLID